MSFGGEPLLFPETVYAIHKAALETGIPKRQLITNGFFSKDSTRIKTVARNLAKCGKLMPSLNSIDGLGEKAADAIVEAAKDGPFLSKDDFRERTKVSKSVIDLMSRLGLLGNIPESNQISIFDLV